MQKDYHKNEGILLQGDSVSDLGILLSGSAHSLKTDITGKQVIVTLLKPGSYVGVLLAASQERKSPVTVQADETSSVLYLPYRKLLTQSSCPGHAVSFITFCTESRKWLSYYTIATIVL